MKGYRDAFHPPPERSPSPPRPQDGLLTPPPEDSPGPSQYERSSHQSNGNGNGNGNAHGQGQGRSRREEPLFEDVDLDEMAAMEEMEREQAEASRRRGISADGSEPPVLLEEDEWEGLYD